MGSYYLIEALDRVSSQGLRFNFLSIAGSNARSLERYYETILDRRKLRDQTWILPMLASWRIPSFLRFCNVICVLERNFPVSFHAPRIPREVLAAGSCLLCSKEIIEKQRFKESMVDGKNFVLIRDPRDVIELVTLY